MRTQRSRAEQVADELVQDVTRLKHEADAKNQEIAALKHALGQFKNRFEIYVQTLQGQRQDLARRVQMLRFLIEHHAEPEPSPPSQEEPSLPPQPEPEPPAEEPSRVPQEIKPVQPSDNLMEQKKKRVRNYFAKFWHPDRQWSEAHPDLVLMRQLDAAFEQSDDLTALLIAVPWHDAWTMRAEDESVGTQLERLYDWQEALEQASGRLDRDMAALQEHEFYSLLLEKQAADERGEDYFAQLALRERDEIGRLESTLAVLQEQYDQLKGGDAEKGDG